MIFYIFFYFLLSCTFAHTQPAPTSNAYDKELSQFFQPTDIAETDVCKKNVFEKMFHDIFTYASQPYSQPIKSLLPTSCPHMSALLCSLSTSYDIAVPMLFIAQDAQAPHIDIKICTFNTMSALLIHPGTVLTLSTKVFEKYIEQAIIRIKTTTKKYAEFKNEKKKQRNWLIAGGCALPLLVYAAGRFTNAWQRAATLGTLIAAGYGAFVQYWCMSNYHSFSFERVSSLHNAEHAREDHYPDGITLSPEVSIITNPGPLFGLQSVIDTQHYLHKRNTEFAIRPKDEPFEKATEQPFSDSDSEEDGN